MNRQTVQLPDGLFDPREEESRYFLLLQGIVGIKITEAYREIFQACWKVQALGCAPVAEALNKKSYSQNIPKIKESKETNSCTRSTVVTTAAPDGDIATVFFEGDTWPLAVTVTEEEIFSATQQLSGAFEYSMQEPSWAHSASRAKKSGIKQSH